MYVVSESKKMKERRKVLVFWELLNQINEGFMPEQVKELRKRK